MTSHTLPSASSPATGSTRSGRRSSARSAAAPSVLTRQVLDAEEAKTLGVISEIVPRDRLLGRAREIAERIARLPPLTASYTRVALTQKLRRIVDETVGYGLALEGISAADVARSSKSLTT